MTSYRLFPSTNGPSTAVSYSGNFISGVAFAVKGGGNWFEGYWFWVAGNASTSPVKFALWAVTSSSGGTVVSGSVVTSGTLTASAWNFVPLAAPVPLAPSFDPFSSLNGATYIAAAGVNANFSDTFSMFNTGDVYAAGITNGPLVAYSGNTGSIPPAVVAGQGLFTTSGTDPAVTMPNGTDGSGDAGSNFWVDVQVRDTPPAGYTGTYRIWPNLVATNRVTVVDTTNNDNIAIEFHLSVPCAISKIWYYSPASAAALGTWAGVYQILGANSGALMASNASPSWSGAAASGWVSCDMGGQVLAAGSYKVSVKGPASNWGAKDPSTGYFNVGVGSAGIVNGPITVPGLATASLAYNYNGVAGGNPPYSDGTTLAGQPTFAIGGSPAYPYLYAPVGTPVASSTQNYWVDIEVTPIVPVYPSVPVTQPPGRQSPQAFQFFPQPVVAAAPPSGVTHPGAATLSGLGTLTATGQKTVPGAATLSGLGTLTATGSKTVPGAAALSGQGTLTATGQKTVPGAATLSGLGALTAAGSKTVPGAATLAGLGTLTAAGNTTRAGAATLSGLGGLTATGNTTRAGAAALSGAGSLTAAGSKTVPGAASLSGAGSLTAAGAKLIPGAAALSGLGSLTAAGSKIIPGAASLSGLGSLTAAGGLAGFHPGAASLTGTGSLTATGTKTVPAAAALTGLGSLTAGGAKLVPGAVSLAGTGILTAAALKDVPGLAALTGAGTLTASGTATGTLPGSALLSGLGVLTAAQTGLAVEAALLSGTVTAVTPYAGSISASAPYGGSIMASPLYDGTIT